MEVDDIFEYDWGSARVSRAGFEHLAKTNFRRSDLCPLDRELSPATLLFNLAFDRVNDPLIQICDLLRFVSVTAFFADE